MAAEVEGVTELLSIGTWIRHHRHHELTGRIKDHEYARPGVLSAIPYLIGWDDSSRACDLLGWMFVYATPDMVEAIPVPESAS